MGLFFYYILLFVIICLQRVPNHESYQFIPYVQRLLQLKRHQQPQCLRRIQRKHHTLQMSFFDNFFSDSKTKSKKNTTKTILTTTSSSSTSSSVLRKKHKNKYEQFAQAIEDRSEEEYFEKLEEATKLKQAEDMIRITTIPTNLKTMNKIRSSSLNNSSANGQPQNRTKISDLIQDMSMIDPSDPFTFGYIELGNILSPHGVYGEMKLEVDASLTEDYLLQTNTTLFIKRPDRRTPRPITLLSCRKQSSTVYLIRLDGITSRMKANLLKKYKAYILKSDLSPLKKDEYFIRDLIGLPCYHCNNQSEILRMKPFAIVHGIVPPDELCENQALAKLMHSLLELQIIGSKQLCLIPFVPSIVREVNMTDKKLLIDPPAGILEITYVMEEQRIVKGLLPARIDWLSDEIRYQLERNTIITTQQQTY